MRMNIRVRPVGPSVEPETLLKFIIKKCAEIIGQNRQSLPRIWVALTLAAVAHDQEFYDGLKQIIDSSSAAPEQILGMCKNVFLPALNRLDGVQTPEGVDTEQKYPPAEEKDYKRLLLYALREGQKMMDSGTYEWVKVFECLTWIGLQYYDFRLYQFESVRQSFQDDPENLVRKGIEIIRAATGVSPRNKRQPSTLLNN
jgi:hypothetical protein